MFSPTTFPPRNAEQDQIDKGLFSDVSVEEYVKS